MHAFILAAGLFASSTAFAADAGNARDSLLQAERSYSARSAVVGFVDATAEVLAESAITITDKSPPIVGKTKMLAVTRDGWPTAEARPVMTWEPQDATVSADGTMGFTYGIYTLHVEDKDGMLKQSQGTFTTVWARKPNGPWRVLMDTGHNGLVP